MNNPWKQIYDTIGEPAAVEMIAEEASELAAAASKLARILRGENPARMDTVTAWNEVLDEINDVFNAIDVLGAGAAPGERLIDPSERDRKMKRWYNSLFGGDA